MPQSTTPPSMPEVLHDTPGILPPTMPPMKQSTKVVQPMTRHEGSSDHALHEGEGHAHGQGVKASGDGP